MGKRINPLWRAVRDSNPRTVLPASSFQDQRNKPDSTNRPNSKRLALTENYKFQPALQWFHLLRRKHHYNSESYFQHTFELPPTDAVHLQVVYQHELYASKQSYGRNEQPPARCQFFHYKCLQLGKLPYHKQACLRKWKTRWFQCPDNPCADE